jgi:hypothetical protein
VNNRSFPLCLQQKKLFPASCPSLLSEFKTERGEFKTERGEFKTERGEFKTERAESRCDQVGRRRCKQKGNNKKRRRSIREELSVRQ